MFTLIYFFSFFYFLFQLYLTFTWLYYLSYFTPTLYFTLHSNVTLFLPLLLLLTSSKIRGQIPSICAQCSIRTYLFDGEARFRLSESDFEYFGSSSENSSSFSSIASPSSLPVVSWFFWSPSSFSIRSWIDSPEFCSNWKV